jgi:hypothetical protein
MKSKEANRGHPFYYTTIHSSSSQEKKSCSSSIPEFKGIIHEKRKYVHTLLLK